MWSVLFLRGEQRSESQTSAWAGERVVRDGFTEILTFELDFDKMRNYPYEEGGGGWLGGVAFSRGNSPSRSTEVPIRSSM